MDAEWLNLDKTDKEVLLYFYENTREPPRKITRRVIEEEMARAHSTINKSVHRLLDKKLVSWDFNISKRGIEWREQPLTLTDKGLKYAFGLILFLDCVKIDGGYEEWLAALEKKNEDSFGIIKNKIRFVKKANRV